jgi:hypothetical protein
VNNSLHKDIALSNAFKQIAMTSPSLEDLSSTFIKAERIISKSVNFNVFIVISSQMKPRVSTLAIFNSLLSNEQTPDRLFIISGHRLNGSSILQKPIL